MGLEIHTITIVAVKHPIYLQNIAVRRSALKLVKDVNGLLIINATLKFIASTVKA